MNETKPLDETVEDLEVTEMTYASVGTLQAT